MPSWIYLRDEIHALMYGDRRTVAQGYWMVLRMMRIGEYSRYWNEDRQEAVGGPKWNYDDFTVRVIDTPTGTLSSLRAESGESAIEFTGADDVGTNIYAVEVVNRPPLGLLPRIPSNEDVLFSIDRHHSVTVPQPPFIATGRYNVRSGYPVKGDNGQYEVVLLIATRMHGES